MVVYKPFGLTPLATLDQLRIKYPVYADCKLSYAGRLDPLAEGVMLVLVDDANYERTNYLHLDKEYEFEILFGADTDTGDVLGLAQSITPIAPDRIKVIESEAKRFLMRQIGTFKQDYPRYSSPLIAGKKNFSKKVTIYSAEVLDLEMLTKKQLMEMVLAKLTIFSRLNPGNDFRQTEIISRWREIFGYLDEEAQFIRIKVIVNCSGGTYIRALAERCGKALGLSALALAIRRTKVGECGFNQALRI